MAGVALVIAAVLLGGCQADEAGDPAAARDPTPTNPASGPRPTADSPDQGGAGGPGVGDAIGSGGGGL